jgi:hypothetical protein
MEPPRSGSAFVLGSVLDVSDQASNDVVIGAHSRSARIDQISRELSVHAWSGFSNKKGESSPHQSHHWLRVDVPHCSEDQASVAQVRRVSAAGPFDMNLDSRLRSLLSLQVDVMRGLSDSDLEADLGYAETSVLLLPQMSFDEQSPGFVPRVICGVNNRANEGLLASSEIDAPTPVPVGIPDSQSKTAKALGLKSSSQTVTITNHVVGNADAKVSRTVGSCELIEFSRHADERHDEFVGTTLLRSACGARVDSQEARADAKVFAASYPKSVLGTVGLEPSCCHAMDASQAGSVTGRHAFLVGSLDASVLVGSDELCVDHSEAYRGAAQQVMSHACVSLDQVTRNKNPSAFSIMCALQGDSLAFSDGEVWCQCYVAHSYQHCVRWFVGNLLLVDEGDANFEEIDAVRSILEVHSLGCHSKNRGVTIVCGAWIERQSPSETVDIHRVALQMPIADSLVSAGNFVMFSMAPARRVWSCQYITGGTTETDRPRCWARVAEFQCSVGGPGNIDTQWDGSVDVLMDAWHLGVDGLYPFEVDVHDAVALPSMMLTTVDWVGLGRPETDCGSRTSSSRQETSGSWLSECSTWNAAKPELDVVSVNRFKRSSWESITQFATPAVAEFSLLDNEMSLKKRIQTGPRFSNGLDNFHVFEEFSRLECGTLTQVTDLGTLHVATLDERFIASVCADVRHANACAADAFRDPVPESGPIDVTLQCLGDSVLPLLRKSCVVAATSHQKLKQFVGQSHTVMRPMESNATMQAATRFFFRHRIQTGIFKEQSLDVFSGSTTIAESSHIISCGQSDSLKANVDFASGVPESQMFDGNAESHGAVSLGDQTVSLNDQAVRGSVVIGVGCTRAFTRTHIPQYCNRATWDRTRTPNLINATLQVHVAENFFPPLRAFDLPRVVMAVLLPTDLCETGFDQVNVVYGHLQKTFESLEHRSVADDTCVDLFGDGLSVANASNESFKIQASATCVPSTKLRRVRAGNSLRTFSDPLRNYLRANWSLSEEFAAGGELGTPLQKGIARFVVMTDKRSIEHLSGKFGIDFVTEERVQNFDFPARVFVPEFLRPWFYRDGMSEHLIGEGALLQQTNASVSVLGSHTVVDFSEMNKVDVLGDGMDHAFVNQMGTSRSNRSVVIDASEIKEQGFCFESLRLTFGMSECDVVGGGCVEFGSIAVLVEINGSASVEIISSDAFDETLGREKLFLQAELQQSVSLSEASPKQTCSKVTESRAA